MGFNKFILPKVSKLNKMYEEDPHGFMRRVKKTDAFIGSMESINWVEDKIKKYNYE